MSYVRLLRALCVCVKVYISPWPLTLHSFIVITVVESLPLHNYVLIFYTINIMGVVALFLFPIYNASLLPVQD